MYKQAPSGAPTHAYPTTSLALIQGEIAAFFVSNLEQLRILSLGCVNSDLNLKHTLRLSTVVGFWPLQYSQAYYT